MTSAAQAIRDARETYLMTGAREARAQLNGAVTDSATTITFDNPMIPLAPNQLLEIDNELMTVWSVSGSVATVLRGDEGTTAAAHADNSVIKINPIFPNARILRAMQAEITSLAADPTLWKPTIVELEYDSSELTYDLGAVDVLGIAAVDTEDDDDWTPLYRWRLVRGLTGQTGITGDVGINILDGHSGDTIRVVAKTPLAQITATTADVETTVGIPSATLLSVGAALHLAAGREIKRTFIEGQGDTRRANEVPAYQTVNATRNLDALYKRLKADAQRTLAQKYPPRRKRQ